MYYNKKPQYSGTFSLQQFSVNYKAKIRIKVSKNRLVKTFDNQLPVILLAIRLWSEDLKHLIIGTGYPNYRVSIYLLEI